MAVVRRDDDFLFSTAELDAYLRHKQQELIGEVRSASEDYLLNTDEEEWADYLAERYSVPRVKLDREALYLTDLGEVQVDVSHDFRRAIFDPSEPTYVPGRAVEVRVPFSGNADLFHLAARQRSFSPPRATIRDGEVVQQFAFPSDHRPDVKAEAEDVLSKIERALSWSEGQVNSHNANLKREALEAIRTRRERVLADHAHLDGFGIPVRRRDDAPKTYAAPSPKRRPGPATQPQARQPPSVAPEPTLLAQLYEHALSVVRSMGHALERTPATYRDKGEETLRDQFLAMLNSHYEGQGQAEAFNREGKTDILIRYADRNIFIAEFKWWSGPKGFDEALNQLFSYSTWRDTKLALVVFVRQQNLTQVIEKARSALARRDDLLSFDEGTEEAELRCQMTWPGDPDRRATLTVCFFHLPET